MVELLSPAGSPKALHAAVSAGADAVYAGGDLFSARAFADNFTKEELVSAIDFCHLHGVRLYLTLNTLIKEREFSGLYTYLLPLYEAGLDAVLVQDFGVIRFLKRNFPELPIHASTQMTVTSAEGVRYLTERGISRVVLSRELSLSEIKEIKDETGAELETFIHGALCYCYSGQCLMSSMIGGRSGNRGRCAQACRLPYRVNGGKEGYPLSLKDLNGITLLPQLIEAGVTSFKIEGRMKKPEYVYYVTQIYRKYVDRILRERKAGKSFEEIQKNFRISKDDMEILTHLYIRSETGTGYYERRNGKDMLTPEKPGYSGGGKALPPFSEEKKPFLFFHAEIHLREGEPAKLLVSGNGRQVTVCSSETVTKAQNRPLLMEDVRERISKTGNTPFAAKKIEILADSEVFLRVGTINDMRRRALKKLQDEILSSYRRVQREEKPFAFSKCKNRQEREKQPYFTALVETKEQFLTVLKEPDIREIYLETTLWYRDPMGTQAALEENQKKPFEEKKRIFPALPFLFRNGDAEKVKRTLFLFLREIDGVLVRSIDGISLAKSMELSFRTDANLYTWNRESVAYFFEEGAEMLTMPYELNSHEMRERSFRNTEVLLYGNLPVMVTAGCVSGNFFGCKKKPGRCLLKDRVGVDFPVRNDCDFCYNLLYNSVPVSLFTNFRELYKSSVTALRLSFTTESVGETKQILSLLKEAKRLCQNCSLKEKTGIAYTRGHFARGVD